jgi:hypothetical protein
VSSHLALSTVSESSVLLWLSKAVGGPRGTVAALLPGESQRYVRIPHSLADSSGADVTWKAVTEVTGQVWHSLMEWDLIRTGSSGQEWTGEPPVEGSLADRQRQILYLILGHGKAADGHVLYGFNLNVFGEGGSHERRSGGSEPPFSLTSIASEKTRIGRREFVFFGGPLSVGEPVINLEGDWVELPWFDYVVSATRDWCLASRGDLDSSYLACADPVADAVLKDPRIEALEVTPLDSIAAMSDSVNRLPGNRD